MAYIGEISDLQDTTAHGLALRHEMPFQPEGVIGECDCGGTVMLEDDGLASCTACGLTWRISVIVRVERA